MSLSRRFLRDLELLTECIDCTGKAQNEFCGVKEAFACTVSVGLSAGRLSRDGGQVIRVDKVQTYHRRLPAGRSPLPIQALRC